MNIIHNTFSSVNEVSLNRTCFRLSWRWWTQCSLSSQSSLGISSDRLFSGFGFINNIAMHCFMSGRHIGDTSQMVLHAQYSLVIHGCTATYYNDLRWVGRGMWRGDVIWHREIFRSNHNDFDTVLKHGMSGTTVTRMMSAKTQVVQHKTKADGDTKWPDCCAGIFPKPWETGHGDNSQTTWTGKIKPWL